MSFTISPLLSSPLTPHHTLKPSCPLLKPYHYHHLPISHKPNKPKSLIIILRAAAAAAPGAVNDEWLSMLPEKKKPLYSHSLPCIEAWLKSLGFYQSGHDRAVWFVERSDWHAQLSLDVTDLHISLGYLKTGPGNLEKDVDRRFSYALSREDIENAILGGP
ncbi:hypothetical protein Drorol1_Dr00013159 [Drosera rotundifolia]